MDTGMTPSSLVPSIKDLSGSNTTSIRLDIDTPRTPNAPFVVMAGLDDGLTNVSQQSVTISFWYPRHDRDASTAIHPGSPIDIFAWTKLGLLFNYVAIGFFDELLPILARGFFKNNSTEATQLTAARQFMLLVRVFLAIASDVVLPSSKHRRRVFLISGWLLALGMTGALACILSQNPTTVWHPLLLALPLGHIVASVSADGLMVEYAHREDEKERGCTQMLLLATRIVGELLGRSISSTGTTPTPNQICHGEIDCVLMPSTTFLVATVVAFIAFLSSIFFTRVPVRRRLVLQGHPGTTTASLKLHQAWTTHQRPMYLGFLVFGFLQAASITWVAPSAHDFATKWLHLGDSTQWVSDGINLAESMVAAILMMSFWRNASWKMLTLALLVVSTVCTRLPAALVVLFDASHAETVFLSLHHVAALTESLLSFIRLQVAVEMAMPTMEATSFALTTSTFGLGTIVGSFFSTRLGNLEIVSTNSSTNAIAIACVALIGLRIAVQVGTLHLLPIQKKEVQAQRQAETTQTSFASGVALGTLLLLLLLMTTLNVVALVQGTASVPWINSMFLSG